MESPEEIVSILRNIETLLSRLALPMQPPVEGSVPWLLSLSDEEKRDYARRQVWD